jgi:asparagine synthase (glutamine-hydrolysing)
MCGFVGYITDEPKSLNGEQIDELSAMTNRIVHRGPDDSGYYFDDYKIWI